MASLDISERRVPQDGAITIRVDSRQIDLRVSTMPGKFGEKVVMRIVDQKSAVANLDKLGFSGHAQGAADISQPNGDVLVTAQPARVSRPALRRTGRDRQRRHRLHGREPVEYNLAGINQFQTDKAGFTFAEPCGRASDPDVVMLGEIRDQNTAIATEPASATRALDMRNDAPSAVTRLINVSVQPYLVAAAFVVCSSVAGPKVCPHCAEPAKFEDDRDKRILEQLAEEGHQITGAMEGAGCRNAATPATGSDGPL